MNFFPGIDCSPLVGHPYEYSLTPTSDNTSSDSPSPPEKTTSAELIAPEIHRARMHYRVSGLEHWMVELRKDMPLLAEDRLSCAEPDKVVTTHLIWTVEKPDFENRILTATATYTYNNLVEGNRYLRLDAEKLKILDVTINGRHTGYSTNSPGILLIIIPFQKGKGEISIRYQTHPEASGLYWIDKEYTEGKQHPILFTHFLPTNGASVIPGQHTPSVRMTYEVNVRTENPEWMALSSVSNNPEKRNIQGLYYGLKNDRAFPLHLLSLHVGNFSHHSYGSGRGVYAEDVMLPKAIEGFKKLPKYMKAAIEICGPFNWKRYDSILMGWAFPHMAIEHACGSTFGAIAMEQVAAVLPHELAYSWTGNDITNCTWQEFFWNAGWTTFIEFLICEKVHGTDYAMMNLVFLLNETKDAIATYRDKNPEVLKLCNEDLQAEFTRIPYGKGALFFFMLRGAFGDNKFQQFFGDYLKAFTGNTISEERFLAFLEKWLEMKTKTTYEEFMKKHHILQWLQEAEIPPNAPIFASTLMDIIHFQKEKLLLGTLVDAELIKSWDITTQLTFLSMLESKSTKEHLIALDAQLEYSKTRSVSLMGQWALLCSKAAYLTPETKQLIIRFVIKRNSVHEAKKIVNALCKYAEGRELAQAILEEGKERLFPITLEKIKKIVESIG